MVSYSHLFEDRGSQMTGRILVLAPKTPISHYFAMKTPIFEKFPKHQFLPVTYYLLPIQHLKWSDTASFSTYLREKNRQKKVIK